MSLETQPAALQTSADLGSKANGDVGHTLQGNKSQIAAKAGQHAENIARGTSGAVKTTGENLVLATMKKLPLPPVLKALVRG